MYCDCRFSAVSASAAEYDEYGAPIVTATPTPVPHTEYYEQAPDTDSIEGWPQGPKIEGESAILVDMVTGAVLYSKNADKVQYPASITKIMTSSGSRTSEHERQNRNVAVCSLWNHHQRQFQHLR